METRDRLAIQARERGMSIAALLTELAARSESESESETMLHAERDATRADAPDRPRTRADPGHLRLMAFHRSVRLKPGADCGQPLPQVVFGDHAAGEQRVRQADQLALRVGQVGVPGSR